MITPAARCAVASAGVVNASAVEKAGIFNCEAGSTSGRRLGAGNPIKDGHGAWALTGSSACYGLDIDLATSIADLVGPGSTLTELGAGLGCYTAWLAHHHVTMIAAVDGLVNATKLTGRRVTQWDLTCPMEAEADWVMSLEVAEHIPREYESAYVDNVVRNARCGIILSWATPKQGGRGHVNLKPLAYVVSLMKQFSFHHSLSMSRRLQESATFSWLKANTQVYVRSEGDKGNHTFGSCGSLYPDVALSVPEGALYPVP